MLNYIEATDMIKGEGLRIAIARGMPSPWSQAAKTIFEFKGLEHDIAPFEIGGSNADLHRWSGTNSAPIVAWADEKPIHRWDDILMLAERLAPELSLVPERPSDRALMWGLSHEICGELGLGWNRRLQLLVAVVAAGPSAGPMHNIVPKYRYNERDAAAAGKRMAGVLSLLSNQLKAQYASENEFLVGTELSAADIYLTAFLQLLYPLSERQCPMPPTWRDGFFVTDPDITAALDPILLVHRDKIFAQAFHDPMEF